MAVRAHGRHDRHHGALMTALTVDQARQMGRDKMPLRLVSNRRTLFLNGQAADDGIVASIEMERGDVSLATVFVDWPAKPVVEYSSLSYRGAYLPLYGDESEKVSAWLDGYYGADA